eukprot:jgi/Astpho2/8549/e_gw1.00125.87.1_t
MQVQEHHMHPWRMTLDPPCRRLHQFFMATVPLTSFWIYIQACTPGPLDISIAAFAMLIPCSQQLHCWTHSRRCTVPTQVAWLQNHGVLISPHAHQAHHQEPYSTNFATVNGWWNPVLDANKGWFWHCLASAISAITGVQPRCWQSSCTTV